MEIEADTDEPPGGQASQRDAPVEIEADTDEPPSGQAPPTNARPNQSPQEELAPATDSCGGMRASTSMVSSASHAAMVAMFCSCRRIMAASCCWRSLRPSVWHARLMCSRACSRPRLSPTLPCEGEPRSDGSMGPSLSLPDVTLPGLRPLKMNCAGGNPGCRRARVASPRRATSRLKLGRPRFEGSLAQHSSCSRVQRMHGNMESSVSSLDFGDAATLAGQTLYWLSGYVLNDGGGGRRRG